jgi:hypothetical protein
MQVLWKGPSSYLNRYRLIVLNVPFVFCITTMGLLGWEWPWHWKDMIEALTVSAGHCAQPEVRRRLKHSEKSWDCFFHGLNHCWLFSDHFCKYTWRVDCWSKWTWLAEVLKQFDYPKSEKVFNEMSSFFVLSSFPTFNWTSQQFPSPTPHFVTQVALSFFIDCAPEAAGC